MANTDTALLLRPEAARQMLDIGRNTFYELVKTGKIPSIRLGKSIRIPRQALLNFIESQTTQKAG